MEKILFIGSQKGDVMPKADVSKLMTVSREAVLDQLKKTSPESIKTLERISVEKGVSVEKVLESAQVCREFTVIEPHVAERDYLEFYGIYLESKYGVCYCCNNNLVPFHSEDARATIAFTVDEPGNYLLVFNAMRLNVGEYTARCKLDNRDYYDFTMGSDANIFYDLPYVPGWLEAKVHKLIFTGSRIAFRGVTIIKFE